MVLQKVHFLNYHKLLFNVFVDDGDDDGGDDDDDGNVMG
jgi:hypothetical protein